MYHDIKLSMWVQIILSYIIMNILFKKQHLPVNFRTLSIKFYISGINFAQFVQMDYKL